MRKTKIICTLGPSTDNESVLRELMKNGMDVARINMSHQNLAMHKIRADMVKKIRQELSLPIALLLDTKGPEIRIGKFKDGKISLKKGQTFTFYTDEILGDETKVSISFKDLVNDISEGNIILIDDGLISLRVKECNKNSITCCVLNNGILSDNKGINVPNIKLSLPFISPKDSVDIKFAVEQDFDFIAASFTRTAEDIKLLRKELNKLNANKIKIIAKIENYDGVNNIDEILRVSDGIMVARGDLGVEIPLEDIPIIQKKLIRKACAAGKHVITATQMLESMMINPRPTRAELTDVANAIYDGTSAIMLSGETAAGKYPIEATKTMAVIAERTERDIDYRKRFLKRDPEERQNITSAISHATCTTSLDLNASAILTISKSGRTARMISKYRPSCPIIGGTADETVMRQMNLSWGVIPLLIQQEQKNTDELFNHIVQAAYDKNLVTDGDLVVITAGIPLGVSGTTNLIKAHFVGNVLTSGFGITNKTLSGKACVCLSEEDVLNKFHPGDILVIHETTNNIFDAIKSASAIVAEIDSEISHAAIAGFALNKPTIIGAKDATKKIKHGINVFLDCRRGIVLKKD